MRSDREQLLDISEAIEKILLHRGETRSTFDKNELLQIWIVHHLQIIGEAASRLSEEIRLKNPAVPWGQIIGMRQVLVHGYFEIDLDVVWNAVEANLHPLKKQVEEMLLQVDT